MHAGRVLVQRQRYEACDSAVMHAVVYDACTMNAEALGRMV